MLSLMPAPFWYAKILEEYVAVCIAQLFPWSFLHKQKGRVAERTQSQSLVIGWMMAFLPRLW